MSHSYSLRPNAKGRRGRQSTDVLDESPGGSMGTSSTSQEDAAIIASEPADESLDPAASSATLEIGEQRLQEWRERRVTSSTKQILMGSIPYRVEGSRETWADIQEARRREKARRHVEAVRIRREQLELRYEEDKRGLRARIVALRRECEVKIAKIRQQWERSRAMEQGEEMDDEEMDVEVDDAKTEVDSAYASTEVSSMVEYDDDDDDGRWRSMSQRPPRCPPSETTDPKATPQLQRFLPSPPPSPLRQLCTSKSPIAGPSHPRPEVVGRPHTGTHPLQRQQAQLIMVPSFGLFPATTESDEDLLEDKDSDMGGVY